MERLCHRSIRLLGGMPAPDQRISRSKIQIIRLAGSCCGGLSRRSGRTDRTPGVNRKAPSGSCQLRIVPRHTSRLLSRDAACSKNPGPVEYQGVWVRTGERIFHVGPIEGGTNNIGEYLALVHGLALLKSQGRPNTPIYTDSRTARAWVRNRQPKTTLPRTPQNERLFEMIERATAWLNANPLTNPILTWDTPAWGEIPADFGRK